MSAENRTCEIKGCGNLGELHNKKTGKKYRRKWCSSHKRLIYGLPNKTSAYYIFKRDFGNKCHNCGWIGPCDIHRLLHGDKGGKYSYGNMVATCPNCHRLHHRGIITLGRKTGSNKEAS